MLRPDIMTFSRDLEGREWREGGGGGEIWLRYQESVKNSDDFSLELSANLRI